ncbi:hypothetical protein UFOVP22_4 [uncultured Caudovirales phage]|uniref:Holin of 3TMs, for gene-transfer release n=1 Tax=uncultured Caudovirales phage TaxID=2100421 RepID=A0A6J5T7P5_9CAUD|nr:hypothetical protein UFOVP22_4 [uncultured Caudovirales phage]
MGALFSFLGGSVFRMVWGEVSNAYTKYQDHKQEIISIELQDKVEGNRADRELLRLKTLSELGIKQIEVQSDADLSLKDADSFVEAMKTINVKTGIQWVDAWNGIIRPSAATTAIAIWWLCLYTQSFVLTEWDKELVGVILGFYFAHRVFINKK